MLAIRDLRERTDAVRVALGRRGDPSFLEAIDRAVELDARRRAVLAEAERLRASRNQVSQQIGGMTDRAAARPLIEEMRRVGDRIRELQQELAGLGPEIEDLLLRLPNLPHASVPDGKTAADNVVVREWGERTQRPAPPHWEIGEQLDILDFPRAAKLSGSMFAIWRGVGARLQRALIWWALELHTTRHGYQEVWLPHLVRREAMVGTGQLPKFEEDMYRTDPEQLFLIPTAEVPLTNLRRDEILYADELPLYYTAYTPCFRREAGAAGRDTRGMLRVHQFDKVELVKIVRPDTSYDELETLTANSEAALQELRLPYRVVQLCAADLGLKESKTYDLEVWAPGVGQWLEAASCSNLEAYQARRMNLRYRPAPGARPEYVHTLNGSGLALPRVVAALLEHYHQSDGSVSIPEVLWPYMGGQATLKPDVTRRPQ